MWKTCVFLVLVLALAFISLYIYLIWNFDHWRKRGIPGPQPKPLYGTFPCTVTGKKNIIYGLDDIYRKFKNRAKFVGVFMTRNPQLMILDPELVNQILVTNFKCFQDNESSKWMNRNVEPISGSNPFALPAAEWKVKRAEVMAGLTISKVKGMHAIITEICGRLGKYLVAEINDGVTVFDAKDFSLRFTGEVVADVVWGIEAGTFNRSEGGEGCVFLSMSKAMIAQTFYAFTCFFIFGIFPILRRLFNVRFFPEHTDRFFLNLTHMAINMRNSRPTEVKRNDFLQHLVALQQKKSLTDTEVVAHMLTFLFDGFETSASLISHCLLLLGRNPQEQQRLREEIMGNTNVEGILSFDDLMRLPLLEQCVNETLRIFTPLAFMSKICTQACQLENSDGRRLQLQPGDICLISLHSFHHDADYYPEPENFVPQRFSDADGGARRYKDMGVYLPFGNGPRICLGMKFGLAQAKAAIVEVIKNFEVMVDEKTRSDNLLGPCGFIAELDGGIYLNLKPCKLQQL